MADEKGGPQRDPMELVVVEEPEEGMSVEDAYRHLVGLPLEPVFVEPEE